MSDIKQSAYTGCFFSLIIRETNEERKETWKDYYLLQNQ